VINYTPQQNCGNGTNQRLDDFANRGLISHGILTVCCKKAGEVLSASIGKGNHFIPRRIDPVNGHQIVGNTTIILISCSRARSPSKIAAAATAMPIPVIDVPFRSLPEKNRF
jgi:hypothetical protein